MVGPYMENMIAKAVSIQTKTKSLDRTIVSFCEPPLYFLFEIKSPGPSFDALAHKIIQSVKEGGDNFEESLEKTNEMLADIAKGGQTEWVGNLSVIIAQIHDNKLNLTSLGDASCFLIRNRNITEITAEQPKKTEPIQTFAHILSGELKENDRLIIGNQEFFENLPIGQLNQLLHSHTGLDGSLKIKEAATSIVRRLQKQRAKSPNAFLIEIKKGSESPQIACETFYIDHKPSPQLAKIFSRWFERPIRHWKLPPFVSKNKQKILIGLSILIILALIFEITSIINKRHKATLTQGQRKIIMEAEDKNREAGEALKKGEKEAAKKLYQEALNLIGPIKNKETDSLAAKINLQLDKLNEVFRVTPKEVLDFSVFKNASVSQIFVVGQDIYSVDTKTNQIYQNRKNPNFLPQNSGHFVAGTFQDQDNLLLLYQDAEGLYEYKIDDNTLEKAKIVFDEKWQKATILGSYFNNVYLLNPEEGQIFKYQKLTTGYSKGLSYVDQEKVNLKNAISMSVDGYIWILKKDGTVLKLMGGRPLTDFSIKGIPETLKLQNPVKIFTTVDTPTLFILDGNRVLEFDKSGNYLKTFILNLKDIKDLWVEFKAKKIYVLSGTKVYEIKI